MILIADSGSSKCDWVLFTDTNSELKRIRTKGLNPNILNRKQLSNILSKNLQLSRFSNEIKHIYFFGAGCGTFDNQNKVKDVLKLHFNNAKIIVEEDTMAAILATDKKPAIVCILGTGSNCCYYDGNKITTKIPSLGYVVMDEASGNYLGKELLKSYYYQQMPFELKLSFEENFNLNPQKVVKKIYNSKTPNKYLANFARFIFENLEHPFIVKILEKAIKSFIENHLLLYENELKSAPIHFVGSIAYHSKDFISKELFKKGYVASSFIRRPVEKLIDYILNGDMVSVS